MKALKVIFDFYKLDEVKEYIVHDNDVSQMIAELGKRHTPVYSKKNTKLQLDDNGVECREALEIVQYDVDFKPSGVNGINALERSNPVRVWFNPVLYVEQEIEVNNQKVNGLVFIR